MKKRSEPPETWEAAREKIIGLGERSLRKTYYPELQEKLEELERFRALLDQSNDCIFLLALPSLTFIDVISLPATRLFPPAVPHPPYGEIIPRRSSGEGEGTDQNRPGGWEGPGDDHHPAEQVHRRRNPGGDPYPPGNLQQATVWRSGGA